MSAGTTRIAFVKPKPEYGIYGGFEGVVDHLRSGLQGLGFDVTLESLNVQGEFESVAERLRTLLSRQGVQGHGGSLAINDPAPTIYEVPITEACLSAFPEFFSYMAQTEAFERVNVSHYDLVISTQPPSFAISHPRHISLFYHHLKIVYDLHDLVQQIGLFDPGLHRRATAIIRETDQHFLDKVSLFLAGSDTVKGRLSRFNGVADRTVLFQAGLDEDLFNFQGPVSYEGPICVGRHEFPKRPELFIHAMKLLPNLKGVVIGAGGFTLALYDADRYLGDLHRAGEEIDDETLWKQKIFELRKTADLRQPQPNYNSNVSFYGYVPRQDLIKAYQGALCVVCPAYGEDFGLTALEAMAFSKPVIVCRDGGGYAELVEDGINGFVVEPTGEAIAGAIRRLAEDRNLARRLGEAGHQTSRRFSWDIATRVAADAIRRVLDEQDGPEGRRR
jgi:glycosyltransferase involved in cell wall biosynthesis